MNVGNAFDPLTGAGTVRRCKFVTSNGQESFGTEDVVACPDPITAFLETLGIRWATRVDGTVNDPIDVDCGWVPEIFLAWTALSMAAPASGHTIGRNFDVVFDDDGGAQNHGNRRQADDRLAWLAIVDDHVQGGFSRFHARRAFTAPAGTLAGSGHLAAYDVRLATQPIVDECPRHVATPFPQRHGR